jgi:hypothetical protein
MWSRACVFLLATAAIAMGVSGIAGAALSPPRSNARRSPRSGTMQFSSSASDYIPAKVSDAPTSFDPRSTIPVPQPACEVGDRGDGIANSGAVSVPLADPGPETLTAVVAGGWDCSRTTTALDGKQQGSDFTVGLAAVNAAPTVPTMSAASLVTATGGANPGTVRTRMVTIAKRKVTIYTWQWSTTPEGGVLFDTASAEPVPHLLLSANTAATTHGAANRAVQNLLIMLRTGAGVKGTKRGIAAAPTP